MRDEPCTNASILLRGRDARTFLSFTYRISLHKGPPQYRGKNRRSRDIDRWVNDCRQSCNSLTTLSDNDKKRRVSRLQSQRVVRWRKVCSPLGFLRPRCLAGTAERVLQLRCYARVPETNRARFPNLKSMAACLPDISARPHEYLPGKGPHCLVHTHCLTIAP